MPVWLQVVAFCGVLVACKATAVAVHHEGVAQSPAHLVCHIDRRLESLASAIVAPDAILHALNDIIAETDGRSELVAAIAGRYFARHAAVLDALRRNCPLGSRAVPPRGYLPTDPTTLFDLLLAGHRYDLCQYLGRASVSVAQLAEIAPYLENRSLGAVLDRFMAAGRSSETADLLSIPMFGDELVRGLCGPRGAGP